MIISIEHNKQLYYPKVESLTTNSTFPYSLPSANLKCSHMDFIRTDDIIRIGDMFAGRVTNISSDGKSMILSCVGHSVELGHKYITQDFNGSGKTSGESIEYLINTYCNRVTTWILTGNDIFDFNLAANKRTVLDAIGQLETVDSDHILTIDTRYTNDLYDSSVASWMPLKTYSTHQAKHNSSNIYGYSFESVSDNLFNYVKIFGNKYVVGTDELQYNGTAEDTLSQIKYGKREFFYNDSSLNNSEICQYTSEGIVNKFRHPRIVGTIQMKGVDIKPGDMIECNFPLIIDGERIDGDYRVSSVSHSISPWVTSVVVGDLVGSPGGLMSSLLNRFRLSNLDSVK